MLIRASALAHALGLKADQWKPVTDTSALSLATKHPGAVFHVLPDTDPAVAEGMRFFSDPGSLFDHTV